MGMLFDIDAVENISKRSNSIPLKLRESMIDDSSSLFSDIISYVRHKDEVIYSTLMRKLIFNDPDFLSCKKDSRSIK